MELTKGSGEMLSFMLLEFMNLPFAKIVLLDDELEDATLFPMMLLLLSASDLRLGCDDDDVTLTPKMLLPLNASDLRLWYEVDDDTLLPKMLFPMNASDLRLWCVLSVPMEEDNEPPLTAPDCREYLSFRRRYCSEAFFLSADGAGSSLSRMGTSSRRPGISSIRSKLA
jgi:hypothetical protein